MIAEFIHEIMQIQKNLDKVDGGKTLKEGQWLSSEVMSIASMHSCIVII